MSDVKLAKNPDVTSNNNSALMLYIFGFSWSLILTLTAYFWTTKGLISAHWLPYSLCVLAAVQCAAQLYFFLHVAAGTRPRWKFISFWFMLIFVLIIVIGSLWIMHSLNGRMTMSPTDIDTYMQSQQGL